MSEGPGYRVVRPMSLGRAVSSTRAAGDRRAGRTRVSGQAARTGGTGRATRLSCTARGATPYCTDPGRRHVVSIDEGPRSGSGNLPCTRTSMELTRVCPDEGRVSKRIPESRFMGENKAAPNSTVWGRYPPLYTAEGGLNYTTAGSTRAPRTESLGLAQRAGVREVRSPWWLGWWRGPEYRLRASLRADGPSLDSAPGSPVRT